MSRQTIPHGLWPSPITPDTLASALKLDEVGFSRLGTTLVWLEKRGGKGVLSCWKPGERCPRDLTQTHDVAARVGYGGGSFCLGEDHAFYVEREQGRIYRQPFTGGGPVPITPAFGYAASPALSPGEDRLLYVHHYEGQDSLALCKTDGQSWPTRIASGADFYMQPAWHNGGEHVAWVEWDHPQMPWDGTRLMFANLVFAKGECVDKEVQCIAGGDEQAIFQPVFSPDGRFLAYVSNESGYSQVYLRELRSGETRQLTQGDAEYGLPPWVQGMKTIGFSADGRFIYALEHKDARVRMMMIEVEGTKVSVAPGLETYTHLAAITPCETKADRVAMIASSATIPPRVVLFAPGGANVIRRTSSETLAIDGLSRPESVNWTAEDGQQVHGLLYRPTASDYEGEGLPPAVVAIHGGPTGQAFDAYHPRAQFFTTRGYAFIEVNYRGSTGYGRDYQRALDGKWGVLDVEDAVAAHAYLVREKIADPTRIVIMGGSAGGYTVLATLVAHPGTFAAGLCLYGISNLFTLVADTHKFEARYLDRLIGKLPADADIYRQRSPIFNAERIADPVAIFQGSEDRAVPPSQAEEIVASLRQRGVPHEYFLYQGEGHGWRRPETIARHYRDVERFLRQHVIFK